MRFPPAPQWLLDHFKEKPVSNDSEFRAMTARAFAGACTVGESEFTDSDGKTWTLTAKPSVFTPSSVASYVILPREPADPYCVLAGKAINVRLVKPKPKPEEPTLKTASYGDLLERIIEVAGELDDNCGAETPEESAALSLKYAAKACLCHFDDGKYQD